MPLGQSSRMFPVSSFMLLMTTHWCYCPRFLLLQLVGLHLLELKDLWSNMSKQLCPSHWVLGVINFEQKIWGIYDSIPELESATWMQPLFEATIYAISAISVTHEVNLRDGSWTIEIYSPDVDEQQHDSWSCRIFVMMAMSAFKQQLNFKNTGDDIKDDMRAHALNMLLKLLVSGMGLTASNDYSSDDNDIICLDQQPTALPDAIPVLSDVTMESKSVPKKLVSVPLKRKDKGVNSDPDDTDDVKRRIKESKAVQQKKNTLSHLSASQWHNILIKDQWSTGMRLLPDFFSNAAITKTVQNNGSQQICNYQGQESVKDFMCKKELQQAILDPESVPWEVNCNVKEKEWTNDEQKKLDGSLLACAQWEVDYINGYVYSSQCKQWTLNKSGIYDVCKRLTHSDQAFKHAIQQKTKESELPEEEQYELLLAWEKYTTPNTLHTTNGCILQDKLKDPVVFKIFKILEHGSPVECFIELFEAAQSGKLADHKTFKELCDVFEITKIA
ncbi:hypothetical protein BDR06DRAFT_1053653 [Suillus hirtellus]|nr:hypothetical protein BDR06DRAFT_1053653 [Suillus hirtellus]